MTRHRSYSVILKGIAQAGSLAVASWLAFFALVIVLGVAQHDLGLYGRYFDWYPFPRFFLEFHGAVTLTAPESTGSAASLVEAAVSPPGPTQFIPPVVASAASLVWKLLEWLVFIVCVAGALLLGVVLVLTYVFSTFACLMELVTFGRALALDGAALITNTGEKA